MFHKLIGATGLAFALSAGAAGATTIPTALLGDLVAFYTFEAGDARDDSGNGNDGTLGAGSAAPGFVAGLDGTAASFDGVNDRIDTGIDVQRSALPEVTFGALVQLEGFGTSPGGKVLSADDAGFDRTLGIDSRVSNNFGAFTGSNVADGGQGLGDGSVFFIAVSYTGGANSVVYVASETSVTQSTFTDTTGTSGNLLTIGANPLIGGVEFFDGLIDNVFVFDRALSVTELEDVRAAITATPVPLPPAFALLLAGLGATALLGRRRAH